MITAKQIEEAKKVVSSPDPLYEHDDCVRMAYEWLDAQKKIKNPSKDSHPIKHLVERWAGRYVSQSDVEIAAYLHPSIIGKYPYYNISTRLTEPSTGRLRSIGEAGTQGQRDHHDPKNYKVNEDII